MELTRKYTGTLELSRKEMEELARKKFCWGDGEVKAFKNKEDLEEKSKKSGNELSWY